MEYSLSRYFPKGTEYFYYFPDGGESNFFGFDPPWAEELFATPPLSCAGKNVKVVVFGSAYRKTGWDLLYSVINERPINPESLVIIPSEIDSTVIGKERTKKIKKALQEIITKKKLVMSQPLLGEELESLYQIPPELSVFLNDKQNLSAYIPSENFPKRYLELKNGKEFLEVSKRVKFPCVVKVSSSAAGEGVQICKNENDLIIAKKRFSNVTGSIFVEQYIEHVNNVGVQFGIPYENHKPIEVLGFSKQFTTPEGSYQGSIVDLENQMECEDKIRLLLLEKILPKVRQMGWYGVGGFDVLIDGSGECYFIDCNFRMTAMTTFMDLLKSNEIMGPIFTFTGTFTGTKKEFEDKIVLIAKKGTNQKIKIIILLEENGIFHFSAGVFYKDKKDIPVLAKDLITLGVNSAALNNFTNL